MKACQDNNQQTGRAIAVFGIVTNGEGWRFYRLSLEGQVDETALYSVGNMADLLGRVRYIFQKCEQNLLQAARRLQSNKSSKLKAQN